jgi:hypothetical protein
MQLLALVLMLSHNALPSRMLLNLALSLPALAAGAALGVMMFRRIGNGMFRHVVLGLLLVSGLMFVV